MLKMESHSWLSGGCRNQKTNVDGARQSPFQPLWFEHSASSAWSQVDLSLHIEFILISVSKNAVGHLHHLKVAFNTILLRIPLAFMLHWVVKRHYLVWTGFVSHSCIHWEQAKWVQAVLAISLTGTRELLWHKRNQNRSQSCFQNELDSVSSILTPCSA